MQPYKDLSGQSGVVGFDIQAEHIDVEFKGGIRYRYDYKIPGQNDVENMKILAVSGNDLSTYINKNVRKRFATKLV